MAVHAPGPDLGQANLDFLPHVEAIHEIIPSGGSREAPHQFDGLRLTLAPLAMAEGMARKPGSERCLGERALTRSRKANGER